MQMMRAASLAVLAINLAGCVQMPGMGQRAQVASAPRCTDYFFSVYFAEKSAALTKQAQRVVTVAGKHVQGCTVAKVQVVGLADYHGPAEPNMELSRQRAQRVSEALVQAGLPEPAFRLRAVGEDGAIAPDGAKPMRRRTDVFITFAH
jgi:peptidoglycan-associated lipoprotein